MIDDPQRETRELIQQLTTRLQQEPPLSEIKSDVEGLRNDMQKWLGLTGGYDIPKGGILGYLDRQEEDHKRINAEARIKALEDREAQLTKIVLGLILAALVSGFVGSYVQGVVGALTSTSKPAATSSSSSAQRGK